MTITTSRNPVLRDDTFRSQASPHLVGGSGLPGATRQGTMSMRGVIGKGAILLLLVAFSFGFTWDMVMRSGGTSGMGWVMLGGIGGFVASIAISFRPKLAPFVAPIFALLEGLLLGGISAVYESGMSGGRYPAGYDGIVFQAALGTLGVFATMLVLYRSGLIKVTERFRSIVTIAMSSIVLVYLATFVLGMFGAGVPFIHEGGPIGIGFSLLVIGIASMMLLVDFQMIDDGIRTGAPKYMEWYGAFALLVTIVWIYLEMLRLLSKLRGR